MSQALVSSLSRLQTASVRPQRDRESHVRSDTHVFRTSLFALLVALSYYAGTKIGFFLTPAQTPIATFWPPNAILLAAFLLAPTRMWWAFLLAVLPAHLLVQLQTGIPVQSALGWFIGNTGEALLGAACIRYFKKERCLFDSVHGVVIFLVFGVLVAPLLTSFLDAANVVLTGLHGDYWRLWATRLSSNMTAELTIVPTIVTFGLNGASWIRKATLARYVEAGLLALGIVSISVLVFSGQGTAQDSIPVLIYAPLPLLLWASVRFGSGGLSASLLIVALISSWNVTQGRGLFRWASMAENVLYLDCFLCVVTLSLMWLAAVIAERRLIEESLRNTRSELIHAHEQERQRIARELHDDIVQQLALLSLGLDQLRSESESSVKRRLDSLYDQVAEVSKATRDLSHDLHPFGLEYLGVARALRTLCQRTGAENHVAIHFVEENVPPRLAADVSLCLYRVAQEALQNIAKHAHAQTGTVELKVADGRALLRVVDDGVGMTSEQPSGGGMGLASMRERVTALDGTFKIASAPLKGTIVEASVPLSSSSMAKAADAA